VKQLQILQIIEIIEQYRRNLKEDVDTMNSGGISKKKIINSN
jgi:hypothetical protein